MKFTISKFLIQEIGIQYHFEFCEQITYTSKCDVKYTSKQIWSVDNCFKSQTLNIGRDIKKRRNDEKKIALLPFQLKNVSWPNLVDGPVTTSRAEQVQKDVN